MGESLGVVVFIAAPSVAKNDIFETPKGRSLSYILEITPRWQSERAQGDR